MSPPAPSLWGIVLAAGESRRFLEALAESSDPSIPQTLKQLQPFEGEPLIRRITRAALDSGLAGVIVVGGCRADEVHRAIEDLDLHFVENPRFAEGRSTSIRAGLAALPASAEGAMFLPCDQPLLDSETLARLRVGFERDPSAIVVPAHQGRRGAPVTFPRDLFGELSALEGEAGGRDLLGAHPDRVTTVQLVSERPLEDVDTPASLRRLRG